MSTEYPFYKLGHTDESVIQQISKSEFEAHASPDVTERLNKFAQTIRAIAPRSDDFLYFSIIFLKAAETSTIDEHGNLKKIGKENAWGYFDDNWKWHGNVKPHKNNNNDIFPESELKKAARNWVGRPLCVDHKSDSVDGVRGVILDTHFDSKLKQVVGLCALDKVNYPDLARKVQTGVVRYGSMGTAVATSVCSECGNRASTPKAYCEHILNKRAWGEINVGLNPIEYSLVVQPAEPGAILLRCFASIQKHDEELKSYGVDTNKLYNSLDEKTANDLDLLLNSVCGVDGCSLEQRQRIVKGFLNTNGFTKTAATSEDIRNLTDAATALKDPATKEIFDKLVRQAEDVEDDILASGDKLSLPEGETFNSGAGVTSGSEPMNQEGTKTPDNSGAFVNPSEPHPDSFTDEGDLVGRHVFENNREDRNVKLSSIMEEIMNESRLRKRAALRRRLAYHQGGSEGVEPKGFKSEDYHKYWEDDKHMHQTKSMGGDDGMFPGDEKVKEMQKRAKEKALLSKKIAYHFGGSDGVEPKTFKSEDYHKYWEDDKHMHQTKSMGGDDGMFPGDEKIKEMQKRAKYNGPALSTKFKQRRYSDGSINKAASCFEVYAGDKLVIAATAKDIFGPKLNENWDWLNSTDYARTVIAQIRENGLNYVGGLLTKTAQEAPPAPPADAAAPPPADAAAPPPADMGAPPPADMGAPADMAPPEGGAEGESPKKVIEDSLIVMEDTIEKIRDALSDLGSEGVDVNVNVLKPGAEVEGEEALALSKPASLKSVNPKVVKQVYGQLKVALAEAKDSADELALLSETFDRYSSLNRVQKKELHGLSRDAVKDFSNILTSSTSLVSLANSIVSQARIQKSAAAKATAQKNVKVASTDNSLIAETLELRKNRRLNILKTARMEMMGEADDVSTDMADVAGVATKSMEQVALSAPKGGHHSNMGMDHHEVDLGSDGAHEDEASYVADEASYADDEDVDMLVLEDSDGNEIVLDLSDEDVVEALAAIAKKHPAHDEDEDEDEDEEGDVDEDESDDLEAMSDDPVAMSDDSKEGMAKDKVEASLSSTFLKKKAEEEREAYRIKLRRAYNIAMEMQRKGMIAQSRPSLDRQVDSIMDFDDKAFEAFKRSVANFTGTVTNVKTASDVSGLNIGVNDDGEQATQSSGKVDARTLASLWD